MCVGGYVCIRVCVCVCVCVLNSAVTKGQWCNLALKIIIKCWDQSVYLEWKV